MIPSFVRKDFAYPTSTIYSESYGRAGRKAGRQVDNEIIVDLIF